MALKGPQYVDINDPTLPPNVRQQSIEARQAWWNDYVDRWSVVKQCDECGEGLIAEELFGHYRNHLPSKLRPVATDLFLQHTGAERLQILSKYCPECGAFIGIEPCEHV